MLRVVVWAFAYLIVRAYGYACMALPKGAQRVARSFELRLLYRVAQLGPGGLDDAVQMAVLRNAKLYSSAVMRMLHKAAPGSAQEEVALSFVEAVRVSPGFDVELRAFADRHSNDGTRAFLMKVLDTPRPHIIDANALSQRGQMRVQVIERGAATADRYED